MLEADTCKVCGAARHSGMGAAATALPARAPVPRGGASVDLSQTHLLVSDIPADVTEAQISAEFATLGREVRPSWMRLLSYMGRSKGQAHVRFRDRQARDKALTIRTYRVEVLDRWECHALSTHKVMRAHAKKFKRANVSQYPSRTATRACGGTT